MTGPQGREWERGWECGWPWDQECVWDGGLGWGEDLDCLLSNPDFFASLRNHRAHARHFYLHLDSPPLLLYHKKSGRPVPLMRLHCYISKLFRENCYLTNFH